MLVGTYLNLLVGNGTSGIFSGQGRPLIATILSFGLELPLSIGGVAIYILCFHGDIVGVYWWGAIAAAIEIVIVLYLVVRSDWNQCADEAIRRQEASSDDSNDDDPEDGATSAATTDIVSSLSESDLPEMVLAPIDEPLLQEEAVTTPIVQPLSAAPEATEAVEATIEPEPEPVEEASAPITEAPTPGPLAAAAGKKKGGKKKRRGKK